jgi:uncharacterized protein (TIRG00374 family)
LRRKADLRSAVIGVLIGLGCLALLLRQVDLKQSWRILAQLDGAQILIPLAIFFVNLPLRALRWQWIFPAAARPTFGNCLVVLGIANMTNFLLPGRAGDAARCVLVGATPSFNETARTLATLAVERVLDGVAMAGMVIFAIWTLHPPRWVFQLLFVAIVIFGISIVLLVAVRYRADKLIDWARRVLRFLHMASLEKGLNDLLASFADGLSGINSAGGILGVMAITAAIWVTEALTVLGLARSLGFVVSLKSSVVATAVLGLGLMIPGAPGSLGTYELFGTEAFKLVGVPASGALALTLTIHAWVFLVNIVAGVCLLAVKGISLAQLKNRLRQQESGAETPAAETAKSAPAIHH